MHDEFEGRYSPSVHSQLECCHKATSNQSMRKIGVDFFPAIDTLEQCGRGSRNMYVLV